MKSKIIGFLVWSAAFGSIVYSYLSGNENYAGIGVALAWIGVILGILVVVVNAIVFVTGSEEQKKKTKQVYLERGSFSRFIGWLQTAALFIALCVSGHWFTAVFYFMISLIMTGVGYCVRENEKKAADLA